MLSYSSVPHYRKDAYKSSIFSRFVDYPPPVENIIFYYLLLSFSSLSMSTILTSSAILDGDLPLPQFCSEIWSWWITVFFSSTVIFLLPLSLMLSCFPCIDNFNETGSPSDFLVASLDLCGTIISSLNCFTRNPLTKAFFSVMFETLIVCRYGHKNMVLHATPSPRSRGTVTGFLFNTKGFL